MKRQRPESKQQRKGAVDAPSDKKSDEVLLTPHTLRLLKLIQDGSLEHASMAALQLTTITAQSSPLVLWDVLGRLQAFLVNSSWQTRQNASGAMQGVARHLPIQSRQQFLEQILSEEQNQNYLWLTLQDFAQELEAIVQRGRLLWSHSASEEEKREEQILQQMDQQRLKKSTEDEDGGDAADDFVQRRVQWQRRVLAQRIGLSGLLQATGGLPDSCLADTITSEDLEPVQSDGIAKKSPPKRKRKRSSKDEADASKETQDSTMRALLVLEMKREQLKTNGISISHDNPQTLLATELLYRVFDPSWHVRHGALMGMLALLRAWHHGSPARKFGAWPQDILVRCLCILVLDRFGDYSGTTTTSSQEGAESGSVVAPVRETAGQLLSMVWHFAPPEIQKETLKLLYRLARGIEVKTEDGDGRSVDWEIRHGASVALKYIVAVQVVKSKMIIAPEIPKVAINCLTDQADDVQSVGAQILSTLLASPVQHDWKEPALGQVWKALRRTRSVSSSILDLMTLCSDLLQEGVAPTCGFSGQGNDSALTGAGMLDIFRQYLDHDLASVRLAALRSIANSLEPIFKTDGNEIADENVLKALDAVQERIFCSFFHYSTDSEWNKDGHQQVNERKSTAANQPDESGDPNVFIACRKTAWSKLMQILRQRATHKEQQQTLMSLAGSLTFQYFGVATSAYSNDSSQRYEAHSLNNGKDQMAFLIDAADALSDIFLIGQRQSSGGDFANHQLDLLELAIKTFLYSPWRGQCEAACILLRALAKKVGGDSSEASDKLQHVLKSCRQSIITLLNLGKTEIAPVCLAADQCNVTKEILQHRAVLLMRDSAFLNGVELVRRSARDSSSKINDAVDSVRELWKEAILAKGGSKDVFTTRMDLVAARISSMRLFTIMAGSVLAGKQVALALKKATPVIRPIMTSLKNETNHARRAQASDFMAELLTMMFATDTTAGDGQVSPFLKAREKVLSTMCESISSSDDQQPGGATPPIEHSSFARAIQSFIRTISKELDSLERLTPIQLRLQPLVKTPYDTDSVNISRSLNLLEVVCGDLSQDCSLAIRTISDFVPTLVSIACCNEQEHTRSKASKIVHLLCFDHTKAALPVALPGIVQNLEDKMNDSFRLSACQMLLEIVQTVGLELCPFVRSLLRLVMSLMADPLPSCARMANAIFACLVRVAPLVSCEPQMPTNDSENGRYDEASVVDHLIHGRPLPPYTLPPKVRDSLNKGGISLRRYQMEGITWLRFLQGVNLNGALCDSMGLGKTLQALIGVAISHVDGVNKASSKEPPKSLVVCPSSVVGHWEAEIEKFFPDQSIFTSLAFIGSSKDRKTLWNRGFASSNIVVTSYSVLRTDVDVLSKPFWRFCILDEGHLIRNPKTATAKAARRIRSHHKLLLSGTPVQNKVQEIFAAFDFLMPNFLGSPASFAKEFANPITKGHLPGATAEKISTGIEKLKVLHQQVLPFILRREKEEVLKELPPKNVSTVPCEMSIRQRKTYEQFLATEEAKRSVEELQRVLQEAASSSSESPKDDGLNIGSEALKTLLFLRLLCTHPLLVEQSKEVSIGDQDYNIDMSGKFLALTELLRTCGIHQDQVTGADNDTSVLYCDPDGEDHERSDFSNLLDPVDDECLNGQTSTASTSKALVFAQFTRSLDVLEELLVKRHMPSVRYLRLDGRVPATKRTALVDAFNNDPSIKLMLLTTRVGGLGLNLTGADTVIFLENDFNPFADLQAADRAHRIGQAKTVNVYRLVTKNTIEEKIMSIQEKKIALSNAIVNTDNSTLFSMGTDRLLDIFTCRTENDGGKTDQSDDNGQDYNLDALVGSYKDEYSALSVKGFIQALQN